MRANPLNVARPSTVYALIALAALLFVSTGASAASGPELESVTVLEFAPDGTLFIGDSGTGKVHAVTPASTENPAAEAPYNLSGVDATIAALLGTSAHKIHVRDFAIHPKTKEAYLAVARVTGSSYKSAIVIVNQAGKARLMASEGKAASVAVPKTPARSFKFYDDFDARKLTFTDLEFHKGRLYIAGLSNADFASSLWTTPVPFRGTPAMTTVEIYHAVHGQQETRAPIRTMDIVTVAGKDHLIAAYTCTPLVAIAIDQLKDGAHVVGKTIGEMGYGNTPGDLFTYTTQDSAKNTYDVLFLSNKNQTAQVIRVDEIERAVKGAGMTKPVSLENPATLNASPKPMTGIMQIDDQSPQFVTAVRRDVEEGDVEIVSFMKGAYFRLTDFQSEYEIPGFEYPENSDPLRQFQNAMKQAENKAKFVRN